VAAVLEILDVAALSEGDQFDIAGGFKSEWRAHAWEGNFESTPTERVIMKNFE